MACEASVKILVTGRGVQGRNNLNYLEFMSGGDGFGRIWRRFECSGIPGKMPE